LSRESFESDTAIQADDWQGPARSQLFVVEAGLFHRQLAARTSDYVLRRTGFHELKAIAKGIPLANKGKDLNFSRRNRELQTDHFPDGHFDTQNGGNSRFADIDGMPANNRGVARVDSNVYL